MMQPKLQHCEERMKKLNLEILSLDELWQLHEELNQLLSVRLNAEKRALERRLAQLRRENEAANAPTVPAERKRRPYPQVHPKYRNINAPYETWSGRGKQPKWLTAALRTGRSIDDFLISRG
ncbi:MULTISPECIES: H-NS histone family protein [Bradyrhizobium]|uniref:H-NS histone family protein n=1 Tax=Bradyrhizobium TaxID=374 RepID=UPI000A958FB3|nr:MULTISPECIES: H-NS histone family protein [Bradyrhizobium]